MPVRQWAQTGGKDRALPLRPAQLTPRWAQRDDLPPVTLADEPNSPIAQTMNHAQAGRPGPRPYRFAFRRDLHQLVAGRDQRVTGWQAPALLRIGRRLEFPDDPALGVALRDPAGVVLRHQESAARQDIDVRGAVQ